jgi:putative multiple sugar transport system ATP-binding protein
VSETTALPTVAGPILEMRSITKEFPGVKALSDVSITVRTGECTPSAARTAPASRP